MPTCKIFTDSDRQPTADDLETFNRIIIDGLEAVGEHAAVAVIPAARVSLSGCYVELTCRHKPNRNVEMRRKLAARLDSAARQIFGVQDPVRVRILMVEEFELAGVN